MKREQVGCIVMLILIPIILVLIPTIWWVVGYCIVNCANYLAQRNILPDTNTAYLCSGLLFSMVSGLFKVSVKVNK